MLCLQQKLTYVPVFAHPCGRSVPSKRRTERLKTPDAHTESVRRKKPPRQLPQMGRARGPRPLKTTPGWERTVAGAPADIGGPVGGRAPDCGKGRVRQVLK